MANATHIQLRMAWKRMWTEKKIDCLCHLSLPYQIYDFQFNARTCREETRRHNRKIKFPRELTFGSFTDGENGRNFFKRLVGWTYFNYWIPFWWVLELMKELFVLLWNVSCDEMIYVLWHSALKIFLNQFQNYHKTL